MLRVKPEGLGIGPGRVSGLRSPVASVRDSLNDDFGAGHRDESVTAILRANSAMKD